MATGLKRNKKQRLDIVMALYDKLRYFPKSQNNTTNIDDDPFVNLFNTEYQAIRKLKLVFREFVNQDDDNHKLLQGMSGVIPFPEINRKLEYRLPIKLSVEPVLILKTTR